MWTFLYPFSLPGGERGLRDRRLIFPFFSHGMKKGKYYHRAGSINPYQDNQKAGTSLEIGSLSLGLHLILSAPQSQRQYSYSKHDFVAMSGIFSVVLFRITGRMISSTTPTPLHMNSLHPIPVLTSIILFRQATLCRCNNAIWQEIIVSTLGD